jgi:predicted DNA-binding transcriptional regulator YafY
VPILGTPGEGYELMEGYFLPPLLFTAAEANALFLGGKMLLASTRGQVSADAEHALNKISVALPGDMRNEVQRLVEAIGIIGPARKFDLYEPNLAIMQQAMHERRVVRMRYHSLSRDETAERELEPYELYYLGGVWYAQGYCRLRNDFRAFRLDRIEELHLLHDHYEIRPPRPPSPRPAPVEVRVRFAGTAVRWVRERQHYGFRAEEPIPDSTDVVMVYCVDKLADMTGWLLGWGAAVIALEPRELREMICHEAHRLLEQLA